MPETKVISTLTDLIVSGNDISIRSYYVDVSSPINILQARITNEIGSQDGIPYIKGELLIKMTNYPEHIDCLINEDGELILICDTGDSSNYSINSNGELIYTTIE